VKKTYDAQKSSVTRLINKFRSDTMLTEKDYNDLEQRLFALVNDMGLNFAKYSTLITNSAELNDADEDYRVRYTEAKSVLDNIAAWRRNLTPSTSAATTTVTSASVAAPVSAAPPVLVATPRVQTSTTKTPSIDGAKAPSLTADGSSRVRTKIPYLGLSTSVQVSTYPNILPISTSAPRNVKFSLPAFVASATGAGPKGCSQMTRPTGVTTVTSSTTTRPSVFPNVQSQPFVPQQTKLVPVVENIGSDRDTDFLDPRSRRQKKRGNGQQQQQQRPPPQAQQQQQGQSPPFSDYQKKFDYMERQLAEQKRLLNEALKRKQPSEADLIQKIRRELAAEAAAKSRGDSQRNAPGNPERTQSSASQQSPQSQPSQNQQDASHGRVEGLPDHRQPPPFYHDYFACRGNLDDGVYRPRTDGGPQQPRPPPEQSTPHQQGASASVSTPAPASASAHETSGRASGLPSSSSDFRHPSTEYAGRAPGSQQYSTPGSTNFCEEDYRTGKQRPLFKPERHTFDATPKTEQWRTFRASFDAAVGSRRMPDAHKLLMLIDLLSGEPKKIARRIAGDVYDTRSYIQVWHTLEEHYGGLNRAKKDVLHKLETFPRIAKFNKDNALEFSSLLLNILNKYANQGPGLTDEGGVLSSLAKKIIPEFEVVIYFQKLAEYDRPDNLTEFYKFVEQKRIALNLASAHFAPAPKQGSGAAALTQQDTKPDADEEERGVQQSWGQDYGLESRELSKRGDPPQRGESRGDSKGESKSDPKSTELPPCPVCKAKHKLFHCDDFKAMTTNKRYYVTRDAAYCYHCLGPNHSAKNCTWHKDVKCGLENCTRYHHPLLHNFKAQMLITFEEFVGGERHQLRFRSHAFSQQNN
jgi:hypothetical protein